MYNESKAFTAFSYLDTTVSRDGHQEFSCRRACQKKSSWLLFRKYQHRQQHFLWPSIRNDFYLDGVLNLRDNRSGGSFAVSSL